MAVPCAYVTLCYVDGKEIKRTVVYVLHVHMSDT